MDRQMKMFRQIKVKELIEALQQMPEEAFVETEGCDCYGPCDGVSLYNGKVLILRNDDLPRLSDEAP